MGGLHRYHGLVLSVKTCNRDQARHVDFDLGTDHETDSLCTMTFVALRCTKSPVDFVDPIPEVFPLGTTDEDMR